MTLASLAASVGLTYTAKLLPAFDAIVERLGLTARPIAIEPPALTSTRTDRIARLVYRGLDDETAAGALDALDGSRALQALAARDLTLRLRIVDPALRLRMRTLLEEAPAGLLEGDGSFSDGALRRAGALCGPAFLDGLLGTAPTQAGALVDLYAHAGLFSVAAMLATVLAESRNLGDFVKVARESLFDGDHAVSARDPHEQARVVFSSLRRTGQKPEARRGPIEGLNLGQLALDLAIDLPVADPLSVFALLKTEPHWRFARVVVAATGIQASGGDAQMIAEAITLGGGNHAATFDVWYLLLAASRRRGFPEVMSAFLATIAAQPNNLDLWRVLAALSYDQPGQIEALSELDAIVETQVGGALRPRSV